MNNIRFTFYFLFILILHLGCSDDSTSPQIDESEYSNLNFSDQVQLIAYPNIGSLQTNFAFTLESANASLSIDRIKYDLMNDNEYDTTVTVTDTVNTMFSNAGYNQIIASAYLTNGTVLSCSVKVWVTEPQVISTSDKNYFEPNLYNGNFISVTNGENHQVRFIDLNTHAMDNYFNEFNSNRFREMHTSIPSFDGTKLMFDNGSEYYFCYCNIGGGDTNTFDIPLSVNPYPIGQLTWSLDNNFIYAVNYDENFAPNGIVSYNLSNQQTSELYNRGNYICVVPDQNNKLAILETVSDNQSKLIMYNTSTGTVEEEHDNIPFNAPFRILRDGDRIYFDGKLAFYSLSSQKTYTMRFEELNLENHMFGEADINMDGNKFIIGIYDESKSLYEITLPDTFE